MKFFVQKSFLSALLLAPVTVFAAEPVATQQSTFNPLLIGLVSILVVLAGIIAGLAYVYKQLATVYVDKLRKERSSGNVVKVAVLLLGIAMFSVKASAQEAVAKAAEGAAVAATSALINGIPRLDFYALVTIIGFELLFAGVFIGMIYRMVGILRGVPEKAPVVRMEFVSKIMHKLTNTVSVKDEERIVLQHDYDGIRELDNSLPPWWKWGFVLTVVFAFVYMWYYHISDGPNQAQEYAMAVEKAEIEKAAYMAKAGNAIDENNVKLTDDKTELADAAMLFKNTCAACHRDDAGGNVGPNLTDSYWLHGGALPDVFKSIKYGWKDKGMPEWGHNMSAKQIAGLASFIKGLSGKNVPGGKAPQGDLFTETGSSKPAADSAGKAGPKLTAIGKDGTTLKG